MCSSASAWKKMDVQSKVIFVWLVSEFDNHINKNYMNYFCMISNEK